MSYTCPVCGNEEHVPGAKFCMICGKPLPVMKAENYTIEYCPFCDQEVAIRAHGVTACPECGKPLAPCSVCHDERGGCLRSEPCPYGCSSGGDGSEDENIPITNPPMTAEEIEFAWANC